MQQNAVAVSRYAVLARRGAALVLASVLLGGVASADPSLLKLRDDFEGDGLTAGSGLYYKDNAEQRAGRLRSKPDAARSGAKGLELAVTPLCRPEQKDCSERAEVWEQAEVLAGYDKTLWYAISIKLDDPPPAAAHRYMVAQWKRAILPSAKIDYSPFLGFRIIRGHFALTIDSDALPARARDAGDAPLGCADGATPAQQRRSAKQTRLLIAASAGADPSDFGGYNACAEDVRVTHRGPMPKAEARWIDFVFKVKPGPRGDGAIEVFADGRWIVSAKGRIGHDGPGLGPTQYFKFGPYRDGGMTDVWRVFYDSFRRGPTCADVAGPDVCGQLN